jgi:Skp family chaperone for outer membrane proteins
MTSLRICFLLFLLAVAIAHPVDAARAQNSLKPPVTAILDMRIILRDSIAGKAWQDYYNAQRKSHKDQIAAEENALRKAWDDLNRQKSILAPQAFQTRERSFKEMEAAARRKIGAMEQELSRSLRATLAEVRKAMDEKLGPILDQMVKDRGIDMIIANQDLIFFRKDYDVTGEVLRRLNKALPRLDVPALAAKAKK